MDKTAASATTKILVADDNPEIRELLQSILEKAGYAVVTAENGVLALEVIFRDSPDLVLMDIEMPKMTGWEAVKRLKADPILEHMPVLFLTSLSQTQNKIAGLDLGADDYLVKPFDIAELLARIRKTLKRHQSEMDANPLSHLPGNISISREIEERIKADAKFAVLYVDLNNFKAFNDHYGFARGDSIIQETAKILLLARGPGDFVGHIGGDDFIMVTTPERAQAVSEKIIREFDAGVLSHYDPKDRERGYIELADRQGNMTRFPFIGIAIGGVTNEHRPLTSIGQISAIGAEMKKFAKKSPKSACAFDRRAD
jgi:DNA-binding response OmpR family regulator